MFGQNESPTLFALFINSLAQLIKDLNFGVRYANLNVSILLYADDIVLLAETEEDLQQMLNVLAEWCESWKMKINHEKMQIIHFRAKKSKITEFSFNLGSPDNNIAIVNKYRYLGCHLDEHLDYNITGNELADASGRALGKLLGKYFSNNGLGYKTYKKLYDTCICPVMDYCSGVWGYKGHEKIDKVHMRAIRSFLGVNKFAPLCGMEGDMGWTPPVIRRKLEMLRLWNRIMSFDNFRLPRKIYEIMLGKHEPWTENISTIFQSINCLDVYHNKCQILNIKEFLTYANET